MKAKRPHEVLPDLYPSHEQEVLLAAGAIAGAVAGAIAGPPGMLVGVVVGSAIGMTVGRTLDREDERKHLHDDALDREIGVTNGDLGAAPGNTVSHGDVIDVTRRDQELLDSLERPANVTDANSASTGTTCVQSMRQPADASKLQ